MIKDSTSYGNRPDRAQRSMLVNYREQIDALGKRGWLRFKVQRLRALRLPAGTAFEVRTPLAECPLQLRAGTSDTNVFSQIFIHREYRCLDDLGDAEFIVDCGANVGLSAAYLLTRFPAAHLVAIEPDSGNFEYLAKNVAGFGPRCRVVQAGVWSTCSELVVESSQLGESREWAATVRPAQAGESPSVTGVDLGTVLAESGHSRISILKMDIEGSEGEVFSKNVEAWLPRVDVIVIEIHGQRNREIVLGVAEHAGFMVSECEELTVLRRV